MGSLLVAANAQQSSLPPTPQQLLPSFSTHSLNASSKPSQSSVRRFSSSSVASPASILSKGSGPLSSSLKTVTHQHFSGPNSPLALGSSPTSSAAVASVGNPNVGPLNTNSPLALAAAASVTPEKLANLLLIQGPLPIRHITSHLALTIPGFGDLSLSKQRRLIISALDSVDPVNQVRFDKVGWGRWAARKTDSPVTSSSTLLHGTNAAASLQAASSTRRRRESLNPSPSLRPPLSPLLKPADGTASPASILAAASLRSQATSVWADDDDAVAAVRGTPGAVAMLAHRRRHRRRSSIHRAQMTFKGVDDDDDDDDDDDGMDDMDEDDYLDDYYEDEDDDLAVAGDLELDDEDAERRRKLRKEKRRLKLKREASRRPSETDEEDWQSIGAASLRRSSFVNSQLSAVHTQYHSPQQQQLVHTTFKFDQHPSSLKPTTSSLRGTPLGSAPASVGAATAEEKDLGGKEEDAIAALVQLGSYA